MGLLLNLSGYEIIYVFCEYFHNVKAILLHILLGEPTYLARVVNLYSLEIHEQTWDDMNIFRPKYTKNIRYTCFCAQEKYRIDPQDPISTIRSRCFISNGPCVILHFIENRSL